MLKLISIKNQYRVSLSLLTDSTVPPVCARVRCSPQHVLGLWRRQNGRRSTASSRCRRSKNCSLVMALGRSETGGGLMPEAEKIPNIDYLGCLRTRVLCARAGLPRYALSFLGELQKLTCRQCSILIDVMR
jgi:hypothetical protein